MTDLDPKVLAAIERFASVVEDLDPRVRDLMQQLRNGRAPEDVMVELTRLAMENPDLTARIQEKANAEFVPLRADADVDIKESIQALKKLPDRQEALRNLNFDEEDLVFQPEGNSLPQLHPIVMAHIMERLQFDDDIPELRTGDLPLGERPAVPIENPSRNPVALGAQLHEAATEVREELDQAQLAKADALTALEPALSAGGEDSTALVMKAKSEFVAVSEGRVGVDGYRAGHKAALRRVEAPSPQALAAMQEDLRQKYAYKALTSTQGRRSAVPVIGALVQSELAQRGYTVTLERAGSFLGETVAASHEWTCRIDAASGDTQSRFAFIDVAAKAIASGLDRQLAQQGIKQVLLHVEPINEIDKRQVGWEGNAVAGQ